jgi:hypothetical protein
MASFMVVGAWRTSVSGGKYRYFGSFFQLPPREGLGAGGLKKVILGLVDFAVLSQTANYSMGAVNY